MNKLLLLLVAIISLSSDSYAARKKSILKIELDDRSPMTVAIDNRDYKKVGTSMTFGDLPTGRHYLRIYQYKPYADGSGGNAKLVYTGSVKLKKNTITECIVYADKGEMAVTTRDMVMDAPEQQIAPQAPKQVSGGRMVRGSLTPEKMNALATDVKAKITDTDKMKLAQQRLAKETFTTEQVRTMLRWFNFEETRLEFAKWAYDKTINKVAYRDLSSEFDYDASVKELESLVSGSR